MLHVWSLRKQNTETPSNPAPWVTYIPHSEHNSRRPWGPSRQWGTALNVSTLPHCLLSQWPPKPGSRTHQQRAMGVDLPPMGAFAQLLEMSRAAWKKGISPNKAQAARQGPVLSNASGPKARSGRPHLGDAAPLVLHTCLGTVLRK